MSLVFLTVEYIIGRKEVSIKFPCQKKSLVINFNFLRLIFFFFFLPGYLKILFEFFSVLVYLIFKKVQ